MLDGRLNWSITNVAEYTDIQIRHIFDSRYFFFYDEATNMYRMTDIRNDPQPGVESARNNGYATIGDPVRIYQYLLDYGIPGNTQEETIGNMMGWSRDNLHHYSGANTPGNLINFWQYDGFQPVERVLTGTARQDRPGEGIKHYIAGCWGMTGFLKVIMRTCNIPVAFLNIFIHAMPEFMREQLYLSHGDDPYSQFSKTVTPPYPPAEILIDQATYDAWFDYDPSDMASREYANNNLGRRTCEIAVQYLPISLIETYCDDLANNLSHANGEVLKHLNRGHDQQYFTLSELENDHDLWNRMDAYLNSIGGCSNLPSP